VKPSLTILEAAVWVKKINDKILTEISLNYNLVKRFTSVSLKYYKDEYFL